MAYNLQASSFKASFTAMAFKQLFTAISLALSLKVAQGAQSPLTDMFLNYSDRTPQVHSLVVSPALTVSIPRQTPPVVLCSLSATLSKTNSLMAASAVRRLTSPFVSLSMMPSVSRALSQQAGASGKDGDIMF